MLGTAVALLLTRFRFRGEVFLFALAMLPLVVPVIVLAVALLVLFLAAGIDRSLWTVAIGHTVVALPFVVLIVAARLAGFDASLEEAAMDLGAPYRRVVGRIILPLIAPAVISAWLVAFTVSLDEFALALFLAGNRADVPGVPLQSTALCEPLAGDDRAGRAPDGRHTLLVLLAEWIRRRGRSELAVQAP